MNSDTAPRRTKGCLRWLTLTFLSGVAILALLAFTGFKGTLDRLIALGDKALHIVEKLDQSHITDTFRESLLLVSPTKGDVLELSTLEMEETMTRLDQRTVFDLLHLGTTVSEIKIPVVYRYHLKLSDDWKLHARDGHCVVIAPIIRPSQPPAIRTNLMQKSTTAGWARFNAEENLSSLEKDITPMAERRAGAAGKIAIVREGARKAVAEFVKAWLIKEEHWRKDGYSQITVIFADEPESATWEASLSKQSPTAVLP
jgi:hypothetical protein